MLTNVSIIKVSQSMPFSYSKKYQQTRTEVKKHYFTLFQIKKKFLPGWVTLQFVQLLGQQNLMTYIGEIHVNSLSLQIIHRMIN